MSSQEPGQALLLQPFYPLRPAWPRPPISLSLPTLCEQQPLSNLKSVPLRMLSSTALSVMNLDQLISVYSMVEFKKDDDRLQD